MPPSTTSAYVTIAVNNVNLRKRDSGLKVVERVGNF